MAPCEICVCTEYDLLWKSGLHRCKQLRISRGNYPDFIMSPKSSDWCPSRVKTEAEIGATGLLAKERQEPQKPEEAKDSPLESLEGVDPAVTLTVGFGLPELWRTDFYLKPPSL